MNSANTSIAVAIAALSFAGVLIRGPYATDTLKKLTAAPANPTANVRHDQPPTRSLRFAMLKAHIGCASRRPTPRISDPAPLAFGLKQRGHRGARCMRFVSPVCV